jgi:hypothetical protein
MSGETSQNGELTYAPVPAVQGPTRALERSQRLLPGVPLSPPAVAAVGGFVAGVVALVTLRTARNRRKVRRLRNGKRREIGKRSVVATRSFLVDVHLLER